jgi:hypothetical protein
MMQLIFLVGMPMFETMQNPVDTHPKAGIPTIIIIHRSIDDEVSRDSYRDLHAEKCRKMPSLMDFKDFLFFI